MSEYVSSPFLFVGNRTFQITNAACDTFKNDFQGNYLSFKGALPTENKPHQFLFNNQKLDFFGIYELEDLINGLKTELPNSFETTDYNYIVCDPTERFTQAVLQLLVEEIKLKRILGKAESIPQLLFIYPMGMTSHDLRKELSACLFEMKKAEIPVYLLRYQSTEMEVMLYELVNVLQQKSLSQVENEWFFVEQLIGKNKASVTNG